jgi:hypothetical protein
MRRYTMMVSAALLAAGLYACSSEPRDDVKISSAVRQQLTEKQVPGAIEVAVTYGVVTLSGNVPDSDAKAKAEDVAEDVNGVDRVVNNLRTTSAADAPARPQLQPNPPVNPHAPSAPDMR